MLVIGDNFEGCVKRLLEFKEYGFDTETSGVRWEDRLFAIILAVSPSEVYYFNFQEYPGVTPLPRTFIPRMQPIFREGARFYVSNAKFDMRMIWKEGIEPYGDYFCTNAHGRVLKNNHMDYGLQGSSVRLGLGAKEDGVEMYIREHSLFTRETIPGKKKIWLNKRFQDVPLSVMQPYAEQDAKLHLTLGRHIRQEIAAVTNPNIPRHPRDVSVNEEKLTTVCHHMERAGIRIDTEYVKKASAHEKEMVRYWTTEFKRLSAFDFKDSGKHLAQVFTECGYHELPLTEKGNPTFTDSVLADLHGNLPECVRRIRHHSKRDGTYYEAFLYHADSEGFIHANIRQGGTETGRFSYSDPNCQNIPKEDNEKDTWFDPASVVRKSFIPREGHALVMIDYSQQEYRMMLDYAGEKTLIKEVMDGADVHQAMADMVGIDRQQAKTLNFAILYGASHHKLSEMLRISPLEGKVLLEKYYRKLPKVKSFKDAVMKKGQLVGFVTNWAGRRCHIARRDWAYILPNHLIQGGCADVIKFAMPKIHALLEGTKSHMVMQIHDELILDMHPDDFHLVPQIQTIMENIYIPFNGMTLTTSVEHSFVSWGKVDVKKGPPEC